MDLALVWFIAIAVLWTGYFFLEGFDFGVGVLLPFTGPRNSVDRRVAINSIGPVWSANEVWLITAVGAMFAAFPAWYASVLSGFYVPMLVVLLSLIARGVAFKYRSNRDSDRWREYWDLAIFYGSAVPAFLWGVLFANLVQGVAMGPDHVVTAGLLDLFTPYALLGGLTTLSLFTLHGAVFLTLKTEGPVRVRARNAALYSAVAAVPSVVGFAGWTQAAHGQDWTFFTAAAAMAALVLGVASTRRGREGWSFLWTALSVLTLTVTVFGSMYPNVLPSTTDPAHSLTVANASSADYTLTVMSWVALVALPVVMGYQAWSYWVFRRRVTGEAVTGESVTAGGGGGDTGTAAVADPGPPRS
ncbi:cytochrome d ubiquinol oxidase subunit II [Nocardiopsis kunsanensis]|uniref:Cytochrome c oxidase assembly protein n=1 Tax=Nocardiopsis kunsanensis TaxID=141693 RepID=A0A918XAP9_9ACTN|nr:cytochrome d ubiquinol oxidase subunit II [Nocardiopsis kunsanensis]GHD22383.1 cytochrome c oxidase assembly protein [Nocardiopsis kunsanensis]